MTRSGAAWGEKKHCTGGWRIVSTRLGTWQGLAGPVGTQRPFYNSAMFVHLRLHTEFSVVDGTNRIDETVKTAAASRFWGPKFSLKAKAAPCHRALFCWCRVRRAI